VITRFGRDAAVYAATTVLARGTVFLLVPVVTRSLSPDEVGFVELATAAITFVQVVLSLEIGQALARFVPDEQHRSEVPTIASTALWFSVATYVIGSLVVIGAIGLVSPSGITDTTVVVVLAASVGGIFLLVQGQLRWELRPSAYAISSVTYALVTLGVTVLLVVTTQSVAAVFVGQIIGAAAGIAIVGALTRATFEARFDRQWLRRLLAFSLPLVPASLGVLTALYVDRIVIGILLDLEDVAWFSIGHRLASTVGLVMTAVQLALTPLIYAVYRRREAPGQISEAFRVVVGLVLVLWLAVSLLAPELVTIVATATYLPASVVVPLQMPAIILAGLIVFAPGLWIEGRTGTIAVITLGGAAANLLLNLVLIGPLGITGAALATLASSALVFVVLMLMSQRSYPIPYPFLSSALGVVVVTVAILLSGVPTGGAIALPARIGLALAASIALLVLGVVRPGRWLILVRNPG